MLWIKAFHIISVIAWFAGLLYLPRLFVYHTECKDSISHNRFIIMEKRLYWYIMNPAMAFTLIFGMSLIGYGHRGGWLLLKMALVFLLVVFHGCCFYYMRQLANQKNNYSVTFFRWFNEIPTVLLIIIVYLVIFKPF